VVFCLRDTLGGLWMIAPPRLPSTPPLRKPMPPGCSQACPCASMMSVGQPAQAPPPSSQTDAREMDLRIQLVAASHPARCSASHAAAQLMKRDGDGVEDQGAEDVRWDMS
jgi:hypothetical protein